jgi:hypothetical protein
MPTFAYTTYFLSRVLPRRPYLQREWCERTVLGPERQEFQPPDRWRYWRRIPELGGRALRVVTLADGVTIHNAFPDRNYRP